MKVLFTKPHIGSFAKVGDIKEVEEGIGKHLIKHGYASDYRRQGLEEIKDEAKANGKLKDGFANGKVHAVSGKADAS